MTVTSEKQVSIFLMGGLGNQLFQIFTCIAYSIREKRKCVFPYSDTLTSGISRNTYWNNLLQSLKNYTNFDDNACTNQNLLSYPTYKENTFTYQPLMSFNQNNILLYGYFQSFKYFISEWDTILQLVPFTELQTDLRTRYADIFTIDTNIVSMHFRIGDYLQSQDAHPIMPYEYYYNALCHLKNNRSNKSITCLYFCEKQDTNSVMNIIHKLEKHFTSIAFVKATDDMEDWEQMLLMSCCHDNIIANSTFSWWGAFLNTNKQSIVCYPEKWFGPKLGHDTRDLFIDTWQKINW